MMFCKTFIALITFKRFKGFADNQDMSYIFETAGKQKKLTEAGYWFATASKEELQQFIERDPSILKDWDEEYGDRMEKSISMCAPKARIPVTSS